MNCLRSLAHVLFILGYVCHPFYFFNAHLSSLLLTDKDLNYDDLASGLKAALQNDKSAFDADRLQKYTGNSSDLVLSV